VVSTRLRPFYPREDPVPVVQEAEWPSGTLWAVGKSRQHPDSTPGNEKSTDIKCNLNVSLFAQNYVFAPINIERVTFEMVADIK
jgi:hypothetical protein